MQNHDNPRQVYREDAANTDHAVSYVMLNNHQYLPKVEGTIPCQISDQARLSP